MNVSRITKFAFITLLTIGVSAGAVWAAEELYLLDSLMDNPDLFRVELDENTGYGVVTPVMLDIPNGPGRGSYALACTQDGLRCYVIERDFGYFGYVDLETTTYHSIGLDFDFPFTGIAGAVCTADGTIFAASQDTDMIYIIDPETGVVSIAGPVVSMDRQPVDLSGADLACNVAGDMYLWSNAGWTMYQVTMPETFPNPIEAVPVFHASDHPFATGMAFRGNGYGPPMGSTRAPAQFLVQDGDGVIAFDMQGLNHRYGDMSNGSMGGFGGTCTLTIGYYKNHDWNGAEVHICGVALDEEVGAEILWDARGSNFSMLFAQMIAAKLNVGDATGVAIIDDAENWLCQQETAFNGGELFWDAKFDDKAQKGMANSYMTPLDDFNNSNHCD